MTAAPEPHPAVAGVSEAEWQAVTRAVWKENGITIRPTTAIAALTAAAQVRQVERDERLEMCRRSLAVEIHEHNSTLDTLTAVKVRQVERDAEVERLKADLKASEENLQAAYERGVFDGSASASIMSGQTGEKDDK